MLNNGGTAEQCNAYAAFTAVLSYAESFLTPFKFKKMNLKSEIDRVENLRKGRVALGLKWSADLMSAVLKSAKAARTEEQKKAALESLNVFA